MRYFLIDLTLKNSLNLGDMSGEDKKMNGFIKKYDREKGYGFISTSEGDIFFHVKSLEEKGVYLGVGNKVAFETEETPRGIEAINIHIEEMKNQKSFIRLGDVRIKLSNIKDYGIENDSQRYIENIDSLRDEVNELNELIGEYKEKSPTYDSLINKNLKKIEAINIEISSRETAEEYSLAVEKNLRFLYVTTYQEDHYRFYAHNASFDIYQKLNELDSNFIDVDL